MPSTHGATCSGLPTMQIESVTWISIFYFFHYLAFPPLLHTPPRKSLPHRGTTPELLVIVLVETDENWMGVVQVAIFL